MDPLIQDLRYACRRIAGAPLLSAVAILVLTLGIGSNAVVLSVLDGIFLRPPPGVGPTDGLVELTSNSASGGTRLLTYREFLAYGDREAAFSDVAAYASPPLRVATRVGGLREMVSAELVSSSYFQTLDVRMELGSGFVPGNDRRTGGPARAVLGHAFWLGRMGGPPDVVGKSIEVNGRPYTVVGVAPYRFHGARAGDDPIAVWLPANDHPLLFPEEENLLTGDRRFFAAVARLAPGMSAEGAEAVAQNAWIGVGGGPAGGGGDDRRRIEVTPYRGLGSHLMSDAFAFVGLIGGVIGGLVLLIACANVSGLLLGRALRRRREIGIRLALGAGRRRVVRQLLTESVLLALVAGVTGVGLTYAMLDVLERTLFTFPVDLAPSVPTLILTLAVAGGTGIAFGLTPALHGTRAGVFTALKDHVAGAGRQSSRLRDGFTVAQLALSLPLLTAAGLLIGQLVTSQSRSGFTDPEEVLAFRVDLGAPGYAADEVDPLLSRLHERVAGLPGVASATFTNGPPFGSSRRLAQRSSSPLDAEPGRVPRAVFQVTAVDPGYFATMGIPILRGRPLEAEDLPGSPLAAVVDEDAARRAWPGQDPLGQTLRLLGEEETVITVVGVARTVLPGTGWSRSLVYGARRQLPDTLSMTLLVRVQTGATATVADLVRAELTAADPDLPVNATSLGARLRASDTELAHASAGAVACGLIALLLACVGLYAAIATRVVEQTHEIGVRIALGADRGRVIRHFVGRGLRVTVIALAVGLPLSWLMIPVVGTNVVGVGAFAPEVAAGLAVVTALMTGVALVSSWLPARRSTGVDPVLALRSE